MPRFDRLLPAALALGFAPAALAGPDGLPPARADPPLTVGVSPGSAPDAAFSRELFAAVALDLGRPVAWIEVPRSSALGDLAAARFAVAAGPFSPAEAAGRRALPAVSSLGDAILKRAGDGALRSPSDLAGKSLGLLGGPADAPRLRAVAAALRARVPSRPRLADAVADVLAGRLAAAAGPLGLVAAAFDEHPALLEAVGPPVGPVTRLVPVMMPGSDADAVAAALTRMRADGRLAALQRRWFGLALDPPAAKP